MGESKLFASNLGLKNCFINVSQCIKYNFCETTVMLY